MISIYAKRCKHENCKTRPNYNYEGQTEGMFCAKHRNADMIDVVHSKCDFDNCTTRPGFGIPGNKPIRCFQHREEGMISHPTKRCDKKDCKEIAIYGNSSTAIHCENHKEPIVRPG